MRAALGNLRRLKIVKLLSTAHSASVGEIASKIGLSFKSTSRHLVKLRNAGITDRDQQGLVMFYKLAYPKPKLLEQVITMV